MIITEESPRLTRTKTTISTDYQFSACYLTQLGTSFSYDYEYNCPSFCMALTLLWSVLSSPLPRPSGVGKSETIKKVARVSSYTVIRLIYASVGFCFCFCFCPFALFHSGNWKIKWGQIFSL